MAKKLYVGNLSYKINEDELRDAFAAIGEVTSAKIVLDTATGRSRGFGFVEMTNDEEAIKAIAALNDTALLDRTVNVSEAKPQRNRSGSGSRGGQREFDRKGSGGRKPDNWR
jgi:cold-inducible RNA-binding protein